MGALCLLFSSCNENNTFKRELDCIALYEVVKQTRNLADSAQYQRIVSLLTDPQNNCKRVDDSLLFAKHLWLAIAYNQLDEEQGVVSAHLDTAEVLCYNNPSFADNLFYVYTTRAECAAENNRHDNAYANYFQAKRLVDKIPDCKYRVMLHGQLGSMLFKQRKYEQALAYYLEQFREFTECSQNLIIEKAQCTNNIGFSYEMCNNIDSALYYYNIGIVQLHDTAKQLSTRENMRQIVLGLLFGNKGGVLAKLHQYDSAEYYLKESIKINYSVEREISDAIGTKVKLANLYYDWGKIKHADLLVDDILQDSIQYPSFWLSMLYTQLKYKQALKKNNHELALTYLSKEVELRKQPAYSRYYFVEERDYKHEFAMLEKQFELVKLQKQTSTQRWVVYLVTTLFCAFIIITFLLLRNRKLLNKHITELTQLNQTINTTNDKLVHSLSLLEHSQIENTRLVKIVAHDLRSPISGIMSLVRMMRMDKDMTADDIKECYGLIEKAGTNALAFIEDILRAKVSFEELKKEKVDIKHVLESCLQIALPQAQKKNQSIKLNTQSVSIAINQEKIWRALNNIIANAIKFSPKDTEINITQSIADNKLLIAVADNGIGIPPNMQATLFDGFSVNGRKGTDGEASTGIGLAITKQIIDAHKGKIWCESEENKGSTFFIELPLD